MIVILGGGLAGLSTAYHLGELDHVVLESEPDAGGLCRSREAVRPTFHETVPSDRDRPHPLSVIINRTA